MGYGVNQVVAHSRGHESEHFGQPDSVHQSKVNGTRLAIRRRHSKAETYETRACVSKVGSETDVGIGRRRVFRLLNRLERNFLVLEVGGRVEVKADRLPHIENGSLKQVGKSERVEVWVLRRLEFGDHIGVPCSLDHLSELKRFVTP